MMYYVNECPWRITMASDISNISVVDLFETFECMTSEVDLIQEINNIRNQTAVYMAA